MSFMLMFSYMCTILLHSCSPASSPVTFYKYIKMYIWYICLYTYKIPLHLYLPASGPSHCPPIILFLFHQLSPCVVDFLLLCPTHRMCVNLNVGSPYEGKHAIFVFRSQTLLCVRTFSSSFICDWTSGLVPYLGYCAPCVSHMGAHVPL